MDAVRQLQAANEKTKRAADLMQTLPSCSPLLRLHKRAEIREALVEAKMLIEMAEAQL